MNAGQSGRRILDAAGLGVAGLGAAALGAVGVALLALGCTAASNASGFNGSTSGTASGGGATGEGGAGGSGASTGSGIGGDFGAGGGPTGTCDVAAEQQSDATCKIKVTISTFELSRAACWVDAPFAAGDEGSLQFACGDGDAKLTFDGGAFTGSSKDCNLTLTRTTTFPFTDGCTWQSDQTITGSLEGQLQYHYSEKPISGSGCASPCTVDAILSLEAKGPVEVEPPK